MHGLFYGLTALIALLVLIKLIVIWLEPRLVFRPETGEPVTPANHGIQFEDVEVTTADGVRIHGWWIPHREARVDVIFFHGNRGNLSLWIDHLLGIHERRCNLLAFDYRGYGLSQGKPSERGLKLDTEAMLEYFWGCLRDEEGSSGKWDNGDWDNGDRSLRGIGNRSRPPVVTGSKKGTGDRSLEAPPRSRNVRPTGSRPVLYWGRSLGGVTSSWAVTLKPPGALLLEATFPDMQEALRQRPWLRPLGLFSTYELCPASHLEQWRGPTLVVHGDRDPVIPLSSGRKLFDRLQGAKQFCVVKGAGHGTLHENARAYWDCIEPFLEQIQ